MWHSLLVCDPEGAMRRIIRVHPVDLFPIWLMWSISKNGIRARFGVPRAKTHFGKRPKTVRGHWMTGMDGAGFFSRWFWSFANGGETLIWARISLVKRTRNEFSYFQKSKVSHWQSNLLSCPQTLDYSVWNKRYVSFKESAKHKSQKMLFDQELRGH